MKSLKLAAKILITTALLYLVISGIDLSKIVHVIARADLSLVFAAICCTILLNALRAQRWLWLLRSNQPDTRYRRALRSHLFATSTRLIFPGQLGEFGRILAVPGLALTEGVGLASIDSLMGIGTTLFFSSVGVYLVLGIGPAIIVGLLGLLLLIGILRPAILFRPLKAIPCRPVWHDRIITIADTVEKIPRKRRYHGLVLSFGLQGLRLIQLTILLYSLGEIPSIVALAFIPAIQLADVLSFTIGRVGAREWLGLQVFPLFGLAPEAAVSAIFLQTVISNIVPGLVGGVFVYQDRDEALAKLGRIRPGKLRIRRSRRK